VNTIEEKIVSEYTGYNFAQLEELNVFEYWLFLHDAVIHNCMQTTEGKEYLENCWRMEQTEPDRKALREKMKN
jgi:cbb3-type cytochrome oxidase subunit 1